MAAQHGETAFHRRQLAEQRAQFDAGSGWTWWLASRAAPAEVIGKITLSNVVRGPFQSCHLGYGIAAAHQGRGLMHEALSAVIAAVFAPPANLHRIQAAVRPDNPRSIALIERLQFREEGLARDYLFNGGRWRDHRIYTRLNAAFVPPPDWPPGETARPAQAPANAR
jgi:[ribosomal protein S5]-alanine N-acetyltransferase